MPSRQPFQFLLVLSFTLIALVANPTVHADMVIVNDSAGGKDEPAALKQLREIQEREATNRQTQPVQSQPAQPRPGSAGGTVQMGDDADLQELEASQKKLSDQMGALNSVNPVADGAKAPLTGGALTPSTLDGANGQLEVPGALGTMMDMMKNPLVAGGVQKMAKATADPEFMKAAGEIMKNKNLKWMYAGLFIYTILYMLLKRRVLAATDRFLARLMLRGGLMVVFFIGYFLVSYAALGQPLIKILMTMKGAFI